MDYHSHYLRLGVNIDHVATIRNARGGYHPDPVKAAQIVADSGADGITAHLREDRRHINDRDIERLVSEINLPLNLEIAPTQEMLEIALRHIPHAVCLVPEKRTEKTTEGGLNVIHQQNFLYDFVAKLKNVGIKTSLFIEPSFDQIEASFKVKADVVEFHTGRYCDAPKEKKSIHLKQIYDAIKEANSKGLECHAGHGLDYNTVKPLIQIIELKELNIGHFLIGEAIFQGLDKVIKKMRSIIEKNRQTIVKN
ncbi:MAG: pyridoxine 5'-phosphate synthase [Alphaproteobacteria bacterium]|nr:pyridoxine 5'-phosphate synthase [Alphaproteobacteria bacterium]